MPMFVRRARARRKRRRRVHDQARDATLGIMVAPLRDVLAEVADEPVHQERVALDRRVSVPVREREELV